MKRYPAVLSCAVLLLASWIATEANAQSRGKTAAQSHIAAAKAAAYEPGNDLTVLYDTVCEPALADRGPVEPNVQAAPKSDICRGSTGRGSCPGGEGASGSVEFALKRGLKVTGLWNETSGESASIIAGRSAFSTAARKGFGVMAAYFCSLECSRGG